MSKDRTSNRYKELETKKTLMGEATKHINFGVIIFVLIFLYLMLVMINFAVEEKVNYTIAEPGILTHSNVYKGLVIKDEEVVSATDSGDIRYYFTEGSLVRNENVVATIIKDSDTVAMIDEEIFKLNQSIEIDYSAFSESYDYLQARIKNYVINQQNHTFDKTYAVKREIINDIDSIKSTLILQQSSADSLVGTNALLMEGQLDERVINATAPGSGLVSFNIDGLESITVDNFTYEDLNKKPIVEEMSERTTAKEGDILFKVVDNYLWYIAAEIDDECEKEIDGERFINIEFTEKNLSIDVEVMKVQDYGSKTYLILKVDRMLGEFLNDRFVDFRIVHEEHEGIKVPETSITTMRFGKVPVAYVNLINGEYRVYKVVKSEDAPGGESVEGISLRQIKKDGDYYYIPLSDDIEKGDTFSYTDENTLVTSQFIMSDTEEFEGVYVVNKGFAMFKFIETMYREGDYRIVEPYTSYGARMYDRIATEGDSIEEYQIVN